MAKQTALAAELVRRYEMPQPESGLVIWKHGDGSGDKCAAIVTAVHRDSIDVMIFPSGIMLPQPKTGVKFCRDPSLKTMVARNPGGIWDFTDMERRVRSMTDVELV